MQLMWLQKYACFSHGVYKLFGLIESLCGFQTGGSITFLLSPPYTADDSLISGPLALKSYYAVADFMDKKTKFSMKEGMTVQVMQKDPGGKSELCTK